MKVSRVLSLPLAVALVVGVSAVAVAGPATTLPGPVVKAPGSAEARFTFVGLDRDAFTEVAPNSVNLPAGAFSGPISTVRVTGTRVEGGGKLTLVRTAIADLALGCRRGGALNSEWPVYRLDVPANTTVTVVVTAEVPAGLPGRKAGATLGHGALRTPDGVSTLEQHTVEQRFERSGYVDGLTLKASARRDGQVTFSGRLVPARRGETVTLVARAAATEIGADSVFANPESAVEPKSGLKTLGRARTTKGGRFSVRLKTPTGVGVVARTDGEQAGASCAVLVPKTAQAQAQ